LFDDFTEYSVKLLCRRKTKGLRHLLFCLAFCPGMSHSQSGGYAVRRQEQVAFPALQIPVKLKGEFVIARNDGLLVWVNNCFD